MISYETRKQSDKKNTKSSKDLVYAAFNVIVIPTILPGNYFP